MPLYEYECCFCKAITEKISKISDNIKMIACPVCAYTAKKILSKSSIQCDGINDVSWLKSACDNLQRPHEPRIQTRGEYKQYMKSHDIAAIG